MQNKPNTATGPVLIGIVVPLTGEKDVFGRAVMEGALMAVEEANARGGINGRKVRIVQADDMGDPEEAALVWKKLIDQDKVIAIVGSVVSKCSLAGAPICQINKVPMISPTSTNPQVTMAGEYIFRACIIDPYQGTLGAGFACNTLGAHTAACLFDWGSPYARGLAENFRSRFEELGGTLVLFRGHASGITDFSSYVQAVIDLKPDIVFLPDYARDAALIAKQLRAIGFEGFLLGGDGWDSSTLIQVGGKAVDGAFFVNHADFGDPRPLVADFFERFLVRYDDKEPDLRSILGYDAMTILLDSISRAKSTNGERIVEAMMKTDLELVSGHLVFGPDRNPIKSAVIMSVRNGQFMYFCSVAP